MISCFNRFTRGPHRPTGIGGLGRRVGAKCEPRRIIANILLAVMVFAAPAGAAAAPREMLPGPIAARVLRILDGDTIEVAARIWLEQELTVRVRLDGVDAPEMKGHCARERALAVRARDLVSGAAGETVALTQIHYDKFGGRVVARVSGTGGHDLSDALLAQGLAHRYGGGHKRGWCETAER